MRPGRVFSLHFWLLLFLLLAFSQTVSSQRVQRTGFLRGCSPLRVPISCSGRSQEVVAYVAQHPEALRPVRIAETFWSFVVGSTHTWKAQTFGTTTWYDVPSTCRAIGTHCYVFVEDAPGGRGRRRQPSILS